MTDPLSGDKLSDKDIIPLQRVCADFMLKDLCHSNENKKYFRIYTFSMNNLSVLFNISNLRQMTYGLTSALICHSVTDTAE